jgi:hypothetical protein
MSFDRLPDELVVRVFRCLLDEKENYARLRETCRRFCFIIDHELLTAADHVHFPRLALSYCHGCDSIWRAANLDLVQCKHLFFSKPLRLCCLDSIKHLKHKLQQITELTFDGYNSFSGVLNVFLDTLTSVGRVSILRFYYPQNAMFDEPEPLPAARSLAYLRLDLSVRSNLQPSPLNVPARHLSISGTRIRERRSWLRSYLERHGSFVETVACNLDRYNESNKRNLRSLLERFDFDVTLVGGDETERYYDGDSRRPYGEPQRPSLCMLATKRGGRAQEDACKATEVAHRRHTQAEHGGQSPFDRLPDELVVRIVRCLLDEPNCRHLKQLRATCKRFCSLINHKLFSIDEPQLPTVGRNIDHLCVNCYNLWRLTKFKHVKCRHFVMKLPIGKCCLETVEQLKASLKTIVTLTILRKFGYYKIHLATFPSEDDLAWVLYLLSSVEFLYIDDKALALLEKEHRLAWEYRRSIMCFGRPVRVWLVKDIIGHLIQSQYSPCNQAGSILWSRL